MTNLHRAVLLSIRPHYVDLILRGQKTVELRRTNLRTGAGTPVLLYATHPVRAIVGMFALKAVIRDAPATLWRKVGPQSAVSRRVFDAYFDGAALAVGLVVGRTWTFPSPIPLELLRAHWPGFQPPQSFRYAALQHGRESLYVGLDLDGVGTSVPLGVTPRELSVSELDLALGA